MTAIDRIIKDIPRQMKQRGWNKPTLADRAGLKYASVRDIESPDWNPKASTLRALQKAFQRNRK